MTTASASRPNIRQRGVVASVLCALALVTTACGASTTETRVAAVVSDDPGAAEDLDIGFQAADNFEIVDNRGEFVGSEILDFGDSIDELRGTHPGAAPVNISLPGFQSIEWEDLIPPGFTSQEVLARYEERLAVVEPGSPELDALYEEMTAEFDTATVNPELDKKNVQLAGFIAPLTYDGDDITEFLLVPYFGACIHVPAPPANQTVMVTLAEGDSLTLEESWGAVWVAGELTTTTTDTELAMAGYSFSSPQFGVYDSQ